LLLHIRLIKTGRQRYLFAGIYYIASRAFLHAFLNRQFYSIFTPPLAQANFPGIALLASTMFIGGGRS